MKDLLLDKIAKKEMTGCVVGLGYVGLPLAVEMAKAGYRTLGVDVSQSKVDLVNNGNNYIDDITDEDLENVVKSGLLTASTDFHTVKEADFIAICVPTPLDDHQEPDVSCINLSVENIAKSLKTNTIVVLESTTYPGTTEELVKTIIEKESGFKCGIDFYLGFSPERVDPGNALYKTNNTPKLVGGVGKDASELIAAMYRKVLNGDVYVVSSPAIAEMAKILENTYRNVNIGLINEFAILCNRMNINLWEVIDAAKTKPYGFQAFYPGPGLGGHCIPLDPYYLSWKAREFNFHTSMIEASMTINDRMPRYCVERAGNILNSIERSLNNSKVLILGVAYKGNVNDYRESPAISVIEELIKEKAIVKFFDPYIPSFTHRGVEFIGEKELTVELLETMDLVMITTAHSNIDYEFVQKHSKAIFDARNAMKHVMNRDNIEVL